MDEAQKFTEFKKYHEKENLVEEVIREFYQSFLSRLDSTAIDCGSHNGFHTLPLAHCCRKVIGIDANGDFCSKLLEKIQSASLVNCKIIHAAVQDDEQLECITLYVSDNYLGRSSLTKLWNAIDESVAYRPVTAPATTLDRIVESLDVEKVEFIKLELEGGEYRALRGAQKLLERDMPVLVMENSMHAARQGKFLETAPFDFLVGMGYVLLRPDGCIVTRDDLYPFWYLFGVPVVELDIYKPLLCNAYSKNCISRNLF